jgi:hypothetical protein
VVRGLAQNALGLLAHGLMVHPQVAPCGDSLCPRVRPGGQAAEGGVLLYRAAGPARADLTGGREALAGGGHVRRGPSASRAGNPAPRGGLGHRPPPRAVGAVLDRHPAGFAAEPRWPMPVEVTAWYHKPEPIFVDCLALVRRHRWRAW